MLQCDSNFTDNILSGVTIQDSKEGYWTVLSREAVSGNLELWILIIVFTSTLTYLSCYQEA